MKNIFCILLGCWILFAEPVNTDLEKQSVLDGKVEILLPTNFGVMSDEMARVKYPSDRRPTLIYTEETGSINIAFNHIASAASQQQIEAYKNNFVATFGKLYPSAEWKGSGVKEINGRKVGYLEFITPAIDTKVYNLIFFTDLEAKLLMCTFNCVVEKQEEWVMPAKKIMDSITIK